MGSKKFVEYLILNLSFQRNTMDFSLVSDGFLKIITKAIWAYFVRGVGWVGKGCGETKTQQIERKAFCMYLWKTSVSSLLLSSTQE